MLRMARQDGVDVHFFEDRAFVFDFLPWNRLNLGEEFFDAFAAVSLHDSDHHILTTASAAERLTQHAKGLADTRGIAKEKLENAA